MERKVMGNNSRPQKEQALNCPRCQSTNTKFCYYNNYSLTQPRYFCKTCRRYWTEGGTLRNVPVGGGSRKNKLIRSSSSSSSSSTTNKINIIPAVADHHQHQEFSSHQNPYNYYKILHDSSAGQDLNLGFPTTAITPSFAALEILRSTSGGGEGGADLNNSFIIPPPPPPTTANATTLQAGGGGGGGFTFHDLKPTLTTTTTTVSSYMSRYGGGAASGDNEMMINQENSGRLMFPLFGAMKQVSGSGGTTTEVDTDQNSNYGYNWDGMMLGTRSSGASW